VQLLYNAALKFDATFSFLVFPVDVRKRFARLITYALREVFHCGLDKALIGQKPLLPNGIARPAMSFGDDLCRLEKQIAEARAAVSWTQELKPRSSQRSRATDFQRDELEIVRLRRPILSGCL
jgi:hypothetical protein